MSLTDPETIQAIITILSILGGVGAAIYAYLLRGGFKKAAAIVHVLEEGSELATVYYECGADGTYTATDKERLGDALLELLNAAEEAGAEISRPPAEV